MRKQTLRVRRTFQVADGDFVSVELSSELLMGDNPVKVGESLSNTVQKIIDRRYFDENEE